MKAISCKQNQAKFDALNSKAPTNPNINAMLTSPS